MLLVNRLAYSGIYKANPLGGRSGTKQCLLSRWNPDDLCKRIRLIHEMSDRISILNKDACELIEEAYWQGPTTTLYIDPPYFQKGKQLYRCYYDREQHIELNVLLDSLHHGMPGSDILLCYDNDPFIREIYMYPDIEKFNRVYSV
jgi:DNA adenine methylase